jgi:hypothetical protein
LLIHLAVPLMTIFNNSNLHIEDVKIYMSKQDNPHKALEKTIYHNLATGLAANTMMIIVYSGLIIRPEYKPR